MPELDLPPLLRKFGAAGRARRRPDTGPFQLASQRTSSRGQGMPKARPACAGRRRDPRHEAGTGARLTPR